jgi:hypothetical protein
MYEQTGRLYYRGRDAEGNPIPIPITELQNAGFINQINGLIQLYQYHSSVLKDELGEDPNMMTAALQPRVTSDNVAASQQTAAFATDYVYDSYKAILEQTSKKVACLLNNSIRFSAKAYSHLMKEDEVKDRIFSTKFQLLPDAMELQRLEAFLNQAIASNPAFINYVDPFKVMRIAKENVKLAELYIRNASKRMVKMEQVKAQQLSEQNAQVQAQAAQQKAQGDMQLLQEKLETEKQLIQFKAIEDMKVEFVRGAFMIASKSENPQMPAWLTPVLNQIIPGITIPLAQDNQAMIQGAIQQQQMAEQQAMQQQGQAEGEAPEQEMQEQQMMQPQ